MADISLPRTRAALRATAKRLREQLAGYGQTTDAPPPALGDTPERQMLPGYHLPSVIRWGQTPASRLSKKGTWYIIIPFTHTSPGYGRKGYTMPSGHEVLGQQMSRQVYAAAKRLQPGQRLTGQATTNPRFVSVASLRAHQEGLQRRRRGGRAGYVTFRTITPTSPGYHIPPRLAPLRLDPTQEQTARTLLGAVRADLKALFSRKR